MAKNSGQAIRDFFIQLGFNADEVTRGFKGLEKAFESTQKAMTKVSKNAELQRFSDSQTAIEKSRNKHLAANKKALDKQKADTLKQVKQVEAEKAAELKRTQQAEQRAAKARHRANKHEGMLRKARADAERKREADNLKLAESQYAARKKQAKLNLKERNALSQYNKDATSAADKRYAAEARISRISASFTWMLGRQGGEHGKLGGTSELKKYNELFSSAKDQASSARTNSDFRRLNQTITDLNAAYGRLIVKNKELQREFKGSAFAAKAMQDSVRNLARSYVSAFAVIGGAGAAGMTGQELVSLRTTLLAATGNAEDAAKAFEFIKSTSLELGVDLASATKSFAQMGVAAKQAGMSMSDTQELFTAMSEASAAFGMSTVDQERAFRSLVQMLSKQQVMAKLWPYNW